LFQHWQISGSPLQQFNDVFSRLISPYQLNPFNLNPLRDILARHVDFSTLRSTDRPQLFVSATNVRTGHPRVFRNADLSLEAVLASACLPVLFHAVEIDGEHYWDGGYSSNPALLPLVGESAPNDLMLVQINPVQRPGLPTLAHEIIDRISEISFNASLNQELQTLALIKAALREGHANGDAYAATLFRRIEALHIHRIEAQKEMAGFGAASKLNPEWGFLERLRDIGYRAADEWLAKHFDDLGRHSTIDLLHDVARMTDMRSLAEQEKKS
jgi:NTE family protein